MSYPMISEAVLGDRYRCGFNGQERKTKINPSVTSAEFCMYDGRLGRRWNVDPELYPWNSGYATINNNPIVYNDPDGNKPPAATGISTTKPLISKASKEFTEVVTKRALEQAGKPNWFIRALKATGSTVITIGAVLYPTTMGNAEHRRAHVFISEFEIFTNDPSTLGDNYLSQVKERLLNGDYSFMDQKYAKEAYKRSGINGGEMRREKDESNWNSGSLTEAIEKFTPGIEPVYNEKGKAEYKNVDYKITYDVTGDYFRIQDNKVFI